MSATRLEQLAALAPHAGTANHLATAVEGPVVLALLEHATAAEHAARVVLAFDLLVTHLEPDAHLIVAGPLEERALVVLQEVLHRSNLPAGWLAGAVDDDVLVAFLGRSAVAVVDPGDADGAELAQVFGLPVVGGPGAVVGDAGLAPAAGEGTIGWAEAVAGLLARPAVRTELANRARRQVAERLALPA